MATSDDASAAGPSNAAARPVVPPAPLGASSSRQPHPQADEICKEIDWYFCDKNLKKDGTIFSYITAKGPNTPVNVGRLSARLKHKFSPKVSVWQILDACKNSTMVDVVDSKHIQRKVTYVQPESDDEGDGVWDEQDKRPRLKPIPVHPGITAGIYKKNAPTGFEPGFVDAPMTPKEAEEERALYDSLNDAPSRIGSAIERFIARRKLTQQYQKVFVDFLYYGGVYPANRIGQGETKKQIMEDEELSKEEKIELCAQFDVDWEDKQIANKWAIDFEGVAKAYISTEFAERLDLDYSDAQVDNLCDVLNKFYEYLNYHDVVPKYKDDINAALKIVKLARVQLKTIQKLAFRFPPPFSKACSILFCGAWYHVFGHNASWGEYNENENTQASINDARIIVGAALTALAPDNIFEAAYPENLDQAPVENSFSALKFTEKRHTTLEVTAIEPATNETRTAYNAFIPSNKDMKLIPVGKLICKYWPMPTATTYDIPLHLQPKTKHDATYTFWLEDDILALFFVGMKLNATLCKLDVADVEKRVEGGGLWVLDEVSRFYCGFFEWAANEMVGGKWKGVEWYDEVALMGCTHEEADRARGELEYMRKVQKDRRERGELTESEDEGMKKENGSGEAGKELEDSD